MRLAIIGSRNFDKYKELVYTLRNHFYNPARDQYSCFEIVSGGAIGADSLGARFAKENNIKLKEYRPDWGKFGKKAGFIRNQDIIENSDFVLAFWDGKSRGTANSLNIAKKLKKPSFICYF